MAGALRAALCLLAAAAVLAICGCGGGRSSTQGTRAADVAGQAESSPPSAEGSIEGFGQEAEGGEREAILAAFDGYLEAISRRDYASACAHMDARLHEGLGELAGKAKDPDCARLLSAALSPEAPEAAKTQLQGTVARVRAEGSRGFVVFKAPGARLYDMAMTKESGEWRVASAAAGVLAPES